MPNICDSLQCTRFVKALEGCEKGQVRLSEYEWSFVCDLRRNFDAREDQKDMGLTPWNPTVKQWNWLMDLQRKASR